VRRLDYTHKEAEVVITHDFQTGKSPVCISDGVKPPFNLAVAYEEQQRYDDAIKAYQSALESQAELNVAYNNLARLYIIRKKDYGAAVELFRLMVGARTVGRAHPARWALEVLAEILGEDLVREIQYRRGLVYGLWAYNTFFDDTSYFVISTMSERYKREAILSTVEGWKTGSLEAWKLGYNLALFPTFRPSDLPSSHPSTQASDTRHSRGTL
jgi:tetratricopeptide (TPR) repeat protein